MNIALLSNSELKVATYRMWFHEMADLLRSLGETVSLNILDQPRYDVAVVHWSTPGLIARILQHSPDCHVGIFNPGLGLPEAVRRNVDFCIVNSFLWEELMLSSERRIYRHFDFPSPGEKPVKIHHNGKEPLVLGYIGNPIHYEKELFPTAAAAITRLAREIPIRVKVVTNNASTLPVIPGVHTELIEWDLDTHESHLEDFDIGICPSFSTLAQLQDPFTHIRNPNRVQSLLWRAIPSVASPLPESCQEFRHHEHVLYAQSEAGWYHWLRFLAFNPGERNRIGNAGLEVVRRRFSREAASAAYAKILRDELGAPLFPKCPDLLDGDAPVTAAVTVAASGRAAAPAAGSPPRGLAVLRNLFRRAAVPKRESAPGALPDPAPQLHCQGELESDLAGHATIPDAVMMKWFADRYSTSKHLLTLYSLAVGLGARNIVEIGFGRSTFVLARAASENGGHLTACDRRNFSRLLSGAEGSATTLLHGVSEDVWNQPVLREQGIDFAFLDYFSDPDLQRDFILDEIRSCVKLMKTNALVCIHDTMVPAYSVSRMRLADHFPDMEFMTLPFNYGLTVGRKISGSKFGALGELWLKKPDVTDTSSGSPGQPTPPLRPR